MIEKRLDDITLDDVQSLVDNGVSESLRLEFKRELYSGSDQGRKEFLADVAAMANSAGGLLIIGVEEQEGVPTAVPGVMLDNPDQQVVGLTELIRTGIAPRLTNVHVKCLSLPSRRHVVVLQIGVALQGPHMVIFKNGSRFYGRQGAQRYQMDWGQIRSAFFDGTDLAERFEDWRIGRLGAILAGRGQVEVSSSGTLVLHIAPAPSLSRTSRPDLVSVGDLLDKRHLVVPMCGGADEIRANIDGVIATKLKLKRAVGYIQVFRSGKVELVSTDLAEITENRSVFCPHVAERYLIQGVKRHLGLFEPLGVAGPYLLAAAFLGGDGCIPEVDPYMSWSVRPLDRDLIVLPRVELDLDGAEQSRSVPSIARVLRPMFDAMWQACGMREAPTFDEDGKWTAR